MSQLESPVVFISNGSLFIMWSLRKPSSSHTWETVSSSSKHSPQICSSLKIIVCRRFLWLLWSVIRSITWLICCVLCFKISSSSDSRVYFTTSSLCCCFGRSSIRNRVIPSFILSWNYLPKLPVYRVWALVSQNWRWTCFLLVQTKQRLYCFMSSSHETVEQF